MSELYILHGPLLSSGLELRAQGVALRASWICGLGCYGLSFNFVWGGDMLGMFSVLVGVEGLGIRNGICGCRALGSFVVFWRLRWAAVNMLCGLML